MKKETKSIINDNETGLQGGSYQSIPGLTSEDVLSLENIAVDQDLREKRKGETYRRRSLLGIAALFFVGAVGLSRNRRAPVSLDSAEIVVVSSDSNLDSVEMFAASAEAKAYYESLDAMVSSPSAMTSQCVGAIEVPKVDFGIKPMFLCEGRAATGRDAAMDTISAITAEAMGDDEVFRTAMVALGFAAGLTPGFAVGLITLAAKTAWSLACADVGPSSTALQVEDVARIAKYHIAQKLKDTYIIEMQILGEKLKVKEDYGLQLTELQEFFDEYYEIARKTAIFGPVGIQISTNAAVLSMQLMDAYKRYVDQEKVNDTKCCQWAVDTINLRREVMKNDYAKMKKAFEDYKKRVYDENGWKEDHINTWFCGNIFKGAYTRQYRFAALGDDKSEIATGEGEPGVGMGCWSDDIQRENARKNLRPKLDTFFKDLEAKLFPPKVKAFYDDFDITPDYKCGGQSYFPLASS